MSYLLSIVPLVSVVLIAALLLRRLSRQQREAYLSQRELRYKRLERHLIEAMDKDEKEEYLKNHGNDEV